MVPSEKPRRRPGPRSTFDSLRDARERFPASVSAGAGPVESVSGGGGVTSPSGADVAFRADRVRVWHDRVQLVWAVVCGVAWLVVSAIVEHGEATCRAAGESGCFDGGFMFVVIGVLTIPVWAGGALVILGVRFVVVPLGVPTLFWWLAASGLGIVVGSLGTWEKTEYRGALLQTSRASSGLDRLGWLTLGASIAVLAAVWLARVTEWRRILWPLAVCAVAALLSAGVVVYEWFEIGSKNAVVAERYEVSRGWGLYLTGLAAVSLFIAAMACLQTTRQAPAGLQRSGKRRQTP